MPPAAIASRVFAASSASPRRSSSSSAEAGGNFGARAEAAPLRVDQLAQPPHRASQTSDSVSGSARRRGRGGLLERLDQHLRPLRHVARAARVEPRHRDEHLPERRQPVPRLGREVRAAEERLALGSQEDRQRPAAVAGHRHHRVHVDRVHVGPLLAIDLDVDEALVHQRRRLLVLERLVRHHVAPVAGRVADREQDRLVLARARRERLLAPRVPVDRVVRVLQEVRAGLVGQAIHVRLG